jgi:hydrogenase-4 component F
MSRYGTRDMRLMKGFLHIAPFMATLLLMGAFSLAGTPPFSIFISEIIIIKSGLATAHTVMVAVLLLMMVIIFAGLIHHMGQMAFGETSPGADRGRESCSSLLGTLVLAAVMVLLGVTMPAAISRAANPAPHAHRIAMPTSTTPTPVVTDVNQLAGCRIAISTAEVDTGGARTG